MLKKRRKIFPIGWDDFTLKLRECEYVKMSEDLQESGNWNEK